MRSLRPAFTIIEILISVIILSFAILFVLKIHSDNQAHIVYLTQRNKDALQDSLYLVPEVMKYHRDSKSAYDLLERSFKIEAFKSREILKHNERTITIPEPLNIDPPEAVPGPSATVQKIMLKGKHSSIFYHFKLEGL